MPIIRSDPEQAEAQLNKALTITQGEFQRLDRLSKSCGFEYEIFIILCFAVITSGRYLDNRGLPVIFAVLVALFYTLMSNVFNINGVSPYWQQLVVGVVALVFVIISYVARRASLKGLVQRV